MKFRSYEVNDVGSKMERRSRKWFVALSNCRDNRNLSGCAGILSFIIIMIIFFCNVETKTNPSTGNNEENENRQKQRKFFLKTDLHEGEYCASKGYQIECSNVNEYVMVDVQKEINYFAQKNADSTSLVFTNLQDSSAVMKENWLENVTKSIHSLTIRETFLPTINEKTFEGEPFIEMKELILILNGELSLKHGSFSGLNKLISLSITGMEISSADQETLRDVSSTLSNLQLQACMSDPEVLRNLTGGPKKFEYRKLEVMDVRQNEFATLLADSFSKSRSIVSLYLDYNKFVHSLDVDAFVGITPTQVTMTSSKLTTLPQGIFDPFQNKTYLTLSDNNWNCECSFEWFQELYRTLRIFQTRDLKCYSKGRKYDLYTFSFCESTSTSTSTSTIRSSTAGTVSTTEQTFSDTTATHKKTDASTSTSWVTLPFHDSTNSPTSQSPMKYQQVPCFSVNKTCLAFRQTLPSRFIYLGSKNVRVEFQQIGDEAKYIVTIQNTLGDDMVFVLLNKNGWILCLSDVQNTFELDVLEHGETYIVCIMLASQHTISPTNCQSLSVPSKWQEQSWIVNQFKLPIIVGAVLSIILTILLSTMGMYIYVKKNPDIVYGKENVILIERENSTGKKSVKDLNYEKQKYTPSLMSVSDGYLTPMIYESANDFNVQIPSSDRCYGAEHRSKIYPTVRRTELSRDDCNPRLPHNDDIYESVNVWLSPVSSYRANSASSQNIDKL